MDFEEQEEIFIPEQEESSFKDYTPQKDQVVFLVDASASMFQPNLQNQVPFFMVINATINFLKDKILASESDNIAVVLYNTQNTQNHMEFSQIVVLQELGPPDAPRIKQLQELLDRKDYQHGHGSALLVEALWLCHDLLTHNTSSSSRRILLFTDEDQPNQDKPHDMQRALTRARDLGEQDITLEVFPFNRLNHNFDFRVFYAQAVVLDEDEAAQEVTGAEKLEELMSIMHKREFKKRRLGTLDFVLSPYMKIAVNYYCMLRETKKPTPVKLHSESNKKLKTTTSWICEETGKQLWDHEVGHHYEMGGHKIVFTKEEVSRIKTFDSPGIKLMGFKAREKLKDYMNTRSSYFIYPEDSRIRGSAQVMHALIEEMKQLNKIAIARVIPRQGTLVRFSALLPSEDPKGFKLMFLPFADDIRNPETLKGPTEAPEPTQEMVKSASEMMENIRLKEFDISNYYNPEIQHFYANLEALALEAPNPPPVPDALEPDEEGLQTKEHHIQNFFTQAELGSLKRPAASKSTSKMVKGEFGQGNYSESELKKMKVAELKELCVEKGLNKTGRKDQLIERILTS